jgi:hypothetical protein
MPQISEREFEVLPLRAHAFLEGVPLHDVWAVDLPKPRAGITLDDFRRVAGVRLYTPSLAVRTLVAVRRFVGRLLGWDRTPSEKPLAFFADRLTPVDRALSLAPAGTREGTGGLRVVYRFENEQLDEVINRTVHAAALRALVETANSYRFYLAVYVCKVGRLTPLYMALIDPFRKLIVYPSLLRSVRENWNRTVGVP